MRDPESKPTDIDASTPAGRRALQVPMRGQDGLSLMALRRERVSVMPIHTLLTCSYAANDTRVTRNRIAQLLPNDTAGLETYIRFGRLDVGREADS